MTEAELKSLSKWLKKYPWLWAVRSGWNGVRISAQRTDTTTQLLQAVSVGQTWHVSDEGEFGPQMGELKKSIAEDPFRTEKILSYLEQTRGKTLCLLICHHDKDVIIYKPPVGGWANLLTRTLNIVLEKNREPAVST